MYANAHRGASAGLAIAVCLLTVSPSGAQIAPMPSRKSTVADYPPALPQREGPAPPRVQLALAGEIQVPGPLGWATLTVRDGRLLLTTRAASLSASPEPGSSAEAVAEPALAPADPEAAWVVAADGRHRIRTVPQGRILAEKRSRHGKRAWKRAWTLRLEALRTVLGRIPWIERRVLEMHYGLDGVPPRTLQSIGQELHCTREHVRQIELRARERARRLLER